MTLRRLDPWKIVYHVLQNQLVSPTPSTDLLLVTLAQGPSLLAPSRRFGRHCTVMILHRLMTCRGLVVDCLSISIPSTTSRMDLNFPRQQSSIKDPMGRSSTSGNWPLAYRRSSARRVDLEVPVRARGRWNRRPGRPEIPQCRGGGPGGQKLPTPHESRCHCRPRISSPLVAHRGRTR